MFESIIFIFCFKAKVIIHLAIALIFIALIIPSLHIVSNFSLPFTEEFNAGDNSSNVITMIISLCIIGAGAFIHNILGERITLLIIYGVILICLNLILWRRIALKKRM